MKNLSKLKLNQLGKAELKKREMNILVGGYQCTCACACVGCLCSCTTSGEPQVSNDFSIVDSTDNGEGDMSTFSENLTPHSLVMA